MFGIGIPELAVIIGVILLLCAPMLFKKGAKNLGETLSAFKKGMHKDDDDNDEPEYETTEEEKDPPALTSGEDTKIEVVEEGEVIVTAS